MVRKTKFPLPVTHCCKQAGYVVLAALAIGGCTDKVSNNAQSIVSASSTRLPVISDTTATTPTLSVSAAPGEIHLNWSKFSDTQSVNVYRCCEVDGNEVLLKTLQNTGTNSLNLPSNTPSRDWLSERFRVEVCNTAICKSSAYEKILGVASKTVQTIRPSVFVAGERYAQSLATNSDASVLFIALPAAGAVDIYLRSDSSWTRTQQLKVPDHAISDTRNLLLTSSASGDVMAIYSSDYGSSDELSQLFVAERLGEAWIVTANWPISEEDELHHASHLKQDGSIQISDDEASLILGFEQTIRLYTRDTLNWASGPTIRLSSDKIMMASTADRSISQLFLIEKDSQDLWLSRWELDTQGWVNTSRQALLGLSPVGDNIIALNATSSQIFIGGWQDENSFRRTPVAWRYEVDSAGQIHYLDKVAGSSAWTNTARLRFAASLDFRSIALGWQDNISDDASVSTYVIDGITQQWLAALKLPGAIPTLAKQAFANSIKFAKENNTLFISNLPTDAADTLNKVGEVLVFR